MTVTPGAMTSAVSTSAVKRYRLFLLLSIVANLAAGVIILFWPDSFTNFAGQPMPSRRLAAPLGHAVVGDQPALSARLQEPG